MYTTFLTARGGCGWLGCVKRWGWTTPSCPSVSHWTATIESSIGTVPFLQDGKISMSESVAMMFYIAQKYGPTDALPSVDDARFAKVLQFTLIGEASLSSLMTPLLAVRFAAPNDQKRNWSAVGIESRLKDTAGRISDELGAREFLVSSGLTLADISVATALRIWSRGVGHDLPATLKAYCERLQDRPACKRAMAAHV
jgi:glutathione S-transferase